MSLESRLVIVKEREKVHGALGVYWQSAVGKCVCGREVEFEGSLNNHCGCGRCYNCFGQEVSPAKVYARKW
jgi:hypothetical protein